MKEVIVKQHPKTSLFDLFADGKLVEFGLSYSLVKHIVDSWDRNIYSNHTTIWVTNNETSKQLIERLTEKATHGTLTPLEAQWLKDGQTFYAQAIIEESKND